LPPVQGKKPVGAALVVGGGVGGMQAALDLAEAGIKVYLADKQPCIGGTMAQLDKTFPTNDCSMCIVAPRLVDVGRHLNIEVLTGTELKSVRGEAGNFEVTLRREGRYIDLAKCTGCGACADVCPVQLNAEFDMGLAQRKAIYKRYPQAVPGAYAIDKDGSPACSLACPAGVNACGYITLIAKGKFKEALELERQTNPLPAICGRVCPHPCERDCRRGTLDQPLAIAHLKRFLADWELAQPYVPPPKPVQSRVEKVAVVGAGPGGLTCAVELRRKGYGVTIFEASDRAGGMLASSIPAYQLPRDVLDRELKWILDHGMELKLSSPIGVPGRTIADLQQQGFKAIFLATGAGKGVRMMVEGETDFAAGVVDAVDYLQEHNRSGKGRKAKKVVVVGGGDSAVAAARTAVRLGAEKVTVVYARSEHELPAQPDDVREAKNEGVEFLHLVQPRKVLGKDGKVTGLRCARMELGEADGAGRRRVRSLPDKDVEIPADLIVAAVGQEADLTALPEGGAIRLSRWGAIDADPVTLQTSMPWVFAGGECVSGPSSVIEAVAAGREAAISIDRLFRGENLAAGRAKPKTVRADKDFTKMEPLGRVEIPTLPVAERKGNFKEVLQGYTQEQAVAEAARCVQCATCCECLLCLKACEAKAIDHDMAHETSTTLDVGAIVLSPGFELFDAKTKQEFGYGRYPNVVSSLEFERILSASGPFTGQILRPGDHKHPKKIAFIQCVGSRDEEHNYCSSVCCMYATKEAVIAKEHEHDLDLHIFFIDMRAFGKGFDEYFERAKKEGIKYTRCRPSSVRQVPGTQDLIVRYQDEAGEFHEELFNLVVLSCGLGPLKGAEQFAETLGLQLNEHGFCSTEEFRPVETSRPGVFVCGPFTEPKDIPETVMQASGAAGKALALLSTVRGTLVRKKQYPPEIDVKGQDPRIGVFVCHCGRNIGGVIPVPDVVEYIKTQPDVVHAEDFLYSCSADSQEKIKAAIKAHNLNRVVVAACTPRTHEPLFQSSLREAGLNPYLFDFANIRDQCTWVHMNMPEAATDKAKDLIRMAIAKARLLEPLYRKSLDINHDAVVVGGGLSGMTAALELAEQGFVTHLIERELELGGNMRHTRFLLSGDDPQARLKEIVERVNSHPRIKVHLGTKVAGVEGFFGNFVTKIEKVGDGGHVEQLKHGAIVVAIGAKEMQPTEYLYGKNERVVTQRELEQRIADGKLDGIGNVVMIQCVGSRNEERPYCSRICCQQAVKNALALKEKKPDAGVFVLYRDVRMYGFLEEHYKRAREQGVVFLRYDAEKKPVVEAGKDGKPVVKTHDPILHTDVTIAADLVALSAATVPYEDAKELAQHLKVPLNAYGYFLEAHLKLRPVDFATDGIYLCGLAHSPKLAGESIIQASGAAGRACTILSRDKIELDAALSQPIDDLCDGCAYCVDPCPYKAVTLLEFKWLGEVKKVVDVDEAKCKGCGVCMATCPKKGIMVRHFKLDQIAAQIAAALQPL
jgi:heterodisulfide reductase subunit A-like polyferredoxin